MKETKYKDTKLSFSLILTIIVFYIGIPIGLIYLIVKVFKTPLSDTGIFQTNLIKALILFVLIFLLIFIISASIGGIIGKLKGDSSVKKEDRRLKKDNPYIYIRELPNNFGIGVASLLFDSKIENYKDIVAVILDLCAKKYINLSKQGDKYYIKVLRDIDNNLLSNEKYILSLLMNNNIKNINYQEWYNYCLKDGEDLGLYHHYEVSEGSNGEGLVTKKETSKLKRVHRGISLVIAIIVLLIFVIGKEPLLGLLYALIMFVVSYVVLIIPFYVIFTLVGVINIGKLQSKSIYDIALNNHLKRTNKGIKELQKLISFNNFLSDFGYFVDKRIEEVILWDRYLSYAQVFGLTKEIMNTGYKELVDNSSFQIDDIDNITLSSIEIS